MLTDQHGQAQASPDKQVITCVASRQLSLIEALVTTLTFASVWIDTRNAGKLIFLPN